MKSPMQYTLSEILSLIRRYPYLGAEYHAKCLLEYVQNVQEEERRAEAQAIMRQRYQDSKTCCPKCSAMFFTDGTGTAEERLRVHRITAHLPEPEFDIES